MGYHSKALIYISGSKENIGNLTHHIKQRSETVELFGTAENQYKFIQKELEVGESLDEDLWALRAEFDWFKAYSDWQSAISQLQEYCTSNSLSFNYCRIGEADGDNELIISDDDDDMHVGIERVFWQSDSVKRCFVYDR